MKSQKTLFGLLLLSVYLFACDPAHDHDHDEEELITTVVVNVNNGTSTSSFTFSDPDGVGGTAPTVDTIFLAPSDTFDVTIDFLNESVDPTDTITAEILTEANDHQVFYTITAANLTHSYNDVDGNAMPVGIVNRFITGAASSGTLNIKLKHQPGIKDGNINTGSTDVDIDFHVVIQL